MIYKIHTEPCINTHQSINKKIVPTERPRPLINAFTTTTTNKFHIQEKQQQMVHNEHLLHKEKCECKMEIFSYTIA